MSIWWFIENFYLEFQQAGSGKVVGQSTVENLDIFTKDKILIPYGSFGEFRVSAVLEEPFLRPLKVWKSQTGMCSAQSYPTEAARPVWGRCGSGPELLWWHPVANQGRGQDLRDRLEGKSGAFSWHSNNTIVGLYTKPICRETLAITNLSWVITDWNVPGDLNNVCSEREAQPCVFLTRQNLEFI